MTVRNTPTGFPGGGMIEKSDGPTGINPDSCLFAGRAGDVQGFATARLYGSIAHLSSHPDQCV